MSGYCNFDIQLVLKKKEEVLKPSLGSILLQ